MKKLTVFSFWALFLTSCAISKETFIEDGRKGYVLDCSGTISSWGACYLKAGEICGRKGYDVMQKSGEEGFSGSGGQLGVNFSSLHFRNMVVACKDT